MAPSEPVFGVHAVRRVLAQSPDRVQALHVQTGRSDQRVLSLCRAAETAGIVPERRSREELDRLAGGGRHQGVVAMVRAGAALSEKDLRALLDRLEEPALLLVLDGIQDPHNLGACLRTADAAGAHAVLAPKNRAVGLTGAVRKVASGAAETVPFVQVTNLARTMRWLREAGIWLAGAAQDADANVFDADLRGPLGVVLGAEGGGLRRVTREHCDFVVRLPMLGAVESLNVSVAAGVCLYEALRQRGSES